MDRDAGEPVKGEPSDVAEETLDQGPADLVAAAHVPTRRHDVGAATGEPNHLVDPLWLVGAVRHRDDDEFAGRGRDARPHRVEHPSTEIVAQPAHVGQRGAQPTDDGNGRVTIEVVHDEDLMICLLYTSPSPRD